MEPMNQPTFPGSPDQPTGPDVEPGAAASPAAGVPGVPGMPPATTDGMPPAWNLPPAPFPVAPVMPAISAPAPAKKRGRDPLTIVMVAAAFVALGGVGFAAGRVTAPAPANAGNGGRGGQFGFPGGSFTPGGSFAPGGNGGFGRIAGAVSITGTITEMTADHITLKLTNGSTITIPVDSNTAYHRQASASATDVTTGAQVQVQLSAGANGGGGGGQQPGASGAPGTGGRTVGPASDITIVGQ